MHPPAGLPALPLDHVGVAVRSLDEAAPLFEQIAGQAATPPVRVAPQGAEICFVGALELLAPTDADGPVARFLTRRGPGLHHVAYRTDGLDALMARLRAEGRQFTSDAPAPGAHGHRIAFLHPRSAGGVLVEFVESRAEPSVSEDR